MNGKKNIIHTFGHILYILLYVLLIVFSIIFYKFNNLMVLKYTGGVFIGIGVLIVLNSIRSRRKGNFVENGIYAFVRHPEFLGHIFIILGLVFIGLHILSVATGIILIFLLYFAMLEEEKRNIKKFGDRYRNYMKKIPRINFFKRNYWMVYRREEGEKIGILGDVSRETLTLDF